MARFLTLLTLAVVLLFAVPTSGADEDLEKSIESLRIALGDSESDELSVRLLEDFLVQHPDTKYTASVLNAIGYYQGESLEDPSGAIVFIKGHIAKLEETDHIRGSKVVLASMYDVPEYKEDLRTLVMELNDIGGLSFRNYSTLISTAFGAQEWDLALELVGPAKKEAIPEAVSEDYPEASEETVEERSQSRMTDLSVYEGWALANVGQSGKAIKLFESAGGKAEHDYFDTPEGMLNVYWGKTLLMDGESEGALEKLLPMALWADSETAKDAVEEMFIKEGGCAEDFDQYMYEKRLKHSKTIDGFAALDYEGNERHSKDLMGKVTLLAFWFPT